MKNLVIMNLDNVVIDVFVKKVLKKGDIDIVASSTVLEAQILKCFVRRT